MLMDNTTNRIESEIEVNAYLQNLRYALNNGAHIEFQIRRLVDDKKADKYTNLYTITNLFPDSNPIDAIKHELLTLTTEHYMRTVKDIRFPNRSEMREFGKVYNGNEDVYIKIRVELINAYGQATAFVMSFHFAEHKFTPDMFPYSKKE